MFENSKFIKSDYEKPLRYEEGDYAPIFTKKFIIKKTNEKIILNVYALGLGYVFLNGVRVSDDLFCAPVSDYRKTLWYNSYDVTNLINNGENLITVFLGNGFYNESFSSAWNFDKVEWRDVPKFILEVVSGEDVLLVSDETWRVKKNSFIIFNQYRSGEHFDARLYSDTWANQNLGEEYPFAKVDQNPPQGEFVKFEATPVRELETIQPQKYYNLNDGGVVVDFGVNMAGYVEINVDGKKGDKITLRFAEEIDENYNLKLNDLDCYSKVHFQTCELICGENPVTYKPFFTYFGFRYVKIEGLCQEIEKYKIKAIRVGNSAKRVGFFKSSDEFLNKLHDCAVNSIISNFQYNLTDCPTREKLGWTNDASTSTEHIYYLYNGDVIAFFKKWMRDIADTMEKDGDMSGIAPSPDWGYGYGPVCDVAFFEIAYQNYIFTGDDCLIKKYAPYYQKYLQFLKKKESENYQFILGDWMGYGNLSTSVDFIVKVLTAYFYKVLSMANVDRTSRLEYERRVLDIKEKYIVDGKCTENTQTAVSMLIYFGFYDNLTPLKEQLKILVKENEFHLDTGLLGNKYIWLALDKCNLNDYALKIMKVKGMPSYDFWLQDGATSLYENWTKTGTVSENHHMFSAFNVFNYKILSGIRFLEPINGKPIIEIRPYFANEIDFIHGETQTIYGKVKVDWMRKEDKIEIKILVDGEQTVYYKGERLKVGENKFFERGD